jgi:uncharacterized membrane protein
MTLFAFFGLWSTLGIGVGAVAIPLVIHLINRRRYKIVPWAAMRFLLAAQKQTRKRMRIEQLLLLFVRMALIALLLFAMISVTDWAEAAWAKMGLSRGFGTAARPQRIHHVMVLDASLSMNQTSEGGQSAFETARQLMLKKIQDGQSGDGYSVLILKDSPAWLVGEASQNARKVMEEVKLVQPTHGNSSLPVALSMVAAKLNEAQARFNVQAVYFFTDMQQTTWRAAATEHRTEADGQKVPYLEIEQKARCVFVDVGPPTDAGNLAVTNVAFNAPYVTVGPSALTATVQNFGSEAKRDLRVEVLIGKARTTANDPPLQMRVADQKDVAVPAGGQLEVAFDKFLFPAPGVYAVQVKIAGDALEQDNSRTVVVTVRETIPLLLVNGKAAAAGSHPATEYLRLALNPFPPGAEPKLAPLRPRVVTPSQFSEMSETDLEAFDAVFWCDVGQFGHNDVRKLDGYLRRGGGFFVALGEKSAENLEHYNELLFKNEHGILPARLLKKIIAPPEHRFYLQNTDDNAFRFPPLAAFSEEADKIALGTARFRQFVEAAPVEGLARTILSFMVEFPSNSKVKVEDKLPVNAPALLEWNPPLPRVEQPVAAPGKAKQRVDRHPTRARGKVILFTSTVNLDWNSWFGSPSYLPMMNELTRLALTGRLREQSNTVGGVLEEYLPGGGELDVTLHFPAGMSDAKSTKVHTQLIDEVNLFRWNETEYSGLYRLETDKGQDILFAVNVPTAAADQRGTESDLTRVDEARLKEYYPDWKFQIVRNPLEAAVAGGPENPDAVQVREPIGPLFANIALLLVLGLMFVEIVLAWAFGHYTVTEGALAAAAPGLTTTIVAAVLAVLATLLFGFGAAIIIMEKLTGDFLGFLPDIARTWFENRIQIEPPMPGEGKNWRYEILPWLFGLPGGEQWWSIGFTLAAVLAIFFTYKAEAPRVSLVFKLLLGALRLFLILTAVWFLLPRGQILYERRGYPDMAIVIDDTRSMGEPDAYQDERVLARVQSLSEGIRARLAQELPEKINLLETEIAAKRAGAEKDPELKAEVESLTQRLQYWSKQRDFLQANRWRPSRLQLVQAILQQPEPHWLKTILTKNKTKIHVFHLDVNGRATKLFDGKGDAGEIFNPNDKTQIDRAQNAINQLEPVGNESRLGTALRQVIDHYRGTGLSSVIMFTDGVTTRDDTIAQTADYAAQKGIALFLVGVGDEHELRDLRLHDLKVDDSPYVGDRLPFDVRLTGIGYKDLTVTVVLKLKDKATGKDNVIDSQAVKVDPNGKSVKVQLHDQPKKVGPHKYIIEVEPPKLVPNEKPIPPANLRVERTIDVIDTKQIKVLYVEGQPRYEFRYLKSLLERESLDAKKKKSVELKVVLLDADADFHKQDKTALANFPPTLDELNQYDVIILGDCDPNHKMLKNRLKDIAAWVKGEDAKGRKAAKPGGGLLFIAGSANNPHRYKGTPLADVLPVEPTADAPPKEGAIKSGFRPELTPAGKNHPIFRFTQVEEENRKIWNDLAPIYWSASKYKVKMAAEVLAVHPNEAAEAKDREGDLHFPLIATQYVGTGRSMFMGFDETWRWRKDHEPKYNQFWVQTMRYLSRGRSTRTDLKLDQQTPYRLGQPIKVIVTFPDNTPGSKEPKGPKLNEKTEVKVTVEYKPTDAKDAPREGAIESLTLAKVEGSWGTYEGTLNRTRDGKYRFRLTNPDVSATQPDGEKPGAEAIVVLPPGELDRLRMNYQELMQAAQTTRGQFYRIDQADDVLDQLPPGIPVAISASKAPTLLWNQWWVFTLVLFLITSEWILRKMKHLL